MRVCAQFLVLGIWPLKWGIMSPPLSDVPSEAQLLALQQVQAGIDVLGIEVNRQGRNVRRRVLPNPGAPDSETRTDVEEVVDGIVAAQEHKRAHVFENPVFRPQEDIVRGVAPARRTRVLAKRTGFPRSWYAEAHCKLATIDVTWQLKRVAMNFFIVYEVQ